MKRSTVILIVVSVVAVFAVSASALAPPATGKKPPTTTTTTTQPILRICETFLNTAWVLGHYDEVQGKYTVGGVPACTTLRPEHAGTRTWRVDWTGTMRRPPGRGLRLVFESEVGDSNSAYLDTVVYGTSGSEEYLIAAPDATQFVFVAMPTSGDKWTNMQITLSPLP